MTGAKIASPQRVRALLERHGPTFIKIGQFLALRPDLVPQEYCDELLNLTDQVKPFPFATTRQILAADLGADPETWFTAIGPQPVAAGSLAQVHRARTVGGDDVAIKVQRPGVRELVARDLHRARVLARVLKMERPGGVVSLDELLKELERWFSDELDMNLELRNLTRMYDLTKRSSKWRVPKPYPQLSKNRVLTAEYLEGIPFTELLRFIRAGQTERVAQLGFDREELARNLLQTVLEQIFLHQFFHADTHPGNLLAMRGNCVGFVDFGLADTLDPSFRQGMLRYLSAAYSNDFDAMFQGLTEVLVPGDGSDYARFRGDFFEQSRRWQRERDAGTQGGDHRDSPASRYLVGVLRAARRNGFQIPTAILSMYRSLLTAETVASQLGGEENLASVGSEVFQRVRLESVINALRFENLEPLVTETLALVQQGPRQVRRLLSEVLDGRLTLQLRTVESEDHRHFANLRARVISVSIVSVAIAFLIGATRDARVFGWLRIADVLWAVLALIWLWIILAWRRLSQ